MKASKTFYCRAGWLVDGLGGPIRRDALLEISDGVFGSIHGHPEDFLAVNAEIRLRTVDFSDCTLLPGLMDGHVHLSMSGTTDDAARIRQLENGYGESREVIRFHLQRHLEHGIVAVRDGGDHHGFVARFQQESGSHGGADVRIRSAGRAFHAHGRYGRLIGRPPVTGRSLADSVADDPEAKDHLKIVNSGLNSLKEYGRQTACQFAAADLKKAVATAAARGWKTMIHANGRLPVTDAVEAGCCSIEHGFFMGTDNLKRMADCGTVWVPTAVTMSAYLRLMEPGSPEQSVVRRTLDHQLEQMAAARRLGVAVVLGTDAGSPGVHHGQAVREELGLLMKAGFSIEEAIKCASSAAARLLGLEAWGRIEAGGRACWIAVKGAPDGLPGSLAQIRAIYMDGQLRYETDQGGCRSASPPPAR
ncbi:MAG: amidohydrolase family protein [Thermodesulfobacteriota bacterium]